MNDVFITRSHVSFVYSVLIFTRVIPSLVGDTTNHETLLGTSNKKEKMVPN